MQLPQRSMLVVAVVSIALFVLCLWTSLSTWLAWQASPLLIGALALVAASIAVGVLGIQNLRGRTLSFVAAAMWFIGGFGLLVTLVAAPLLMAAWYSSQYPVAVPTVTLTKGNRTVVLQGMFHMGSRQFYESVVYDLERALLDDYVLFFEGISKPTQEGREWFNNVMGGGRSLTGNYRLMSEGCGLSFQLDFLDVVQKSPIISDEQAVIVDVTASDLRDEAAKIAKRDGVFAAYIDARIESSNKQASFGYDLDGLISLFRSLNLQQQRDVGILCRAYMTHTMRKTHERGVLDPLLLDFRNRQLAQKIENHQHPRVFVTYGAKHLEGTVEELQSLDPEWQIASLKWTRVISEPNVVTGRFGDD